MFIATGAMGGVLPSVVYTGTQNSHANTNTFTFASVAIGTASSRRYCVFAVQGIGSLITGVTVNGVAQTSVLSNNPNFYVVNITTGTTASVVVTMSVSTTQDVAVTAWAMYNIRSATPQATVTSNGVNPAALSLNVPNRGIVIGLAYSGNNGATYTWSGATLDFQQTSGVSNIPRSGASVAVTSAGSPRAVTCTYSASASPRAGALSFR